MSVSGESFHISISGNYNNSDFILASSYGSINSNDASQNGVSNVTPTITNNITYIDSSNLDASNIELNFETSVSVSAAVSRVNSIASKIFNNPISDSSFQELYQTDGINYNTQKFNTIEYIYVTRYDLSGFIGSNIANERIPDVSNNRMKYLTFMVHPSLAELSNNSFLSVSDLSVNELTKTAVNTANNLFDISTNGINAVTYIWPPNSDIRKTAIYATWFDQAWQCQFIVATGVYIATELHNMLSLGTHLIKQGL